jgi:hypothetical protein
MVPCGEVTSLSSGSATCLSEGWVSGVTGKFTRGRGSGLGDGVLVCGACVCPAANEKAMTSNRDAKEILFIGEDRTAFQTYREEQVLL